MDSKTSQRALSLTATSIAYIQANWHSDIVERCYLGMTKEFEAHDFDLKNIHRFEVPGSLEIPLMAQLLAKTGNYSVIIAAGLIVDGGIYRHDFVASTVIEGIMKVQLDMEVPVLSVVLTPHQFHEHETHQQFFKDHFVIKGKQAAQACLQTLGNLTQINSLVTAAT